MMGISNDIRELRFTPVPARATMKRIMKAPAFSAEIKLDGVRQVLANVDGVITLTGRRDSVDTGLKLNKIEHVPHLAEFMYFYPNTVFDGELCYVDGNSNDAVSIMGSKVDLALKKQRERGWLVFVVFDVLMLDKTDLRSYPYHQRRMMLIESLKRCPQLTWNNLPILSMVKPVQVVGTCYKTDTESREEFVRLMFEQVVSSGYEGLILKNTEGVYDHQEWAKVKPTTEFDYVIAGYEPSTSETFQGVGIAALQLGLYNSVGELVEVSKCSGMTNEWRYKFWDDHIRHSAGKETEYVGMVVSVIAQQMFETGALRHPRFVGLRPEAEPKEQTFAKYRISED